MLGLRNADEKGKELRAKGEEQEEEKNPMPYALCPMLKKSAFICVEISENQRTILPWAYRDSPGMEER